MTLESPQNDKKTRVFDVNSRKKEKKEVAPKETGGPKGPEPTRFGDWEVNGRCSDF